MASDIYNTGATSISNANNQGQSALGAFDPNAWQNTTQAGLSGIKSSQDATQNSFIDAFKNQISSQPSATDYYNQGMQNFNVQGLQNTSNQLNNAMLNAPNSNLAAGRGFNMDQGQIDQKTSQDLQRLGPSAAAAQNSANSAQANALNYANNGIQQNTMNLIPYQSQETYLLDSFARQQSGYTTTQQAQLTALQDKLDKGMALSTQEMQSYQALATSEQTYQAALNTANKQYQATVDAQRVAQQYQPVNAGQTLVNTANGSTYRAS